jgi:hypothetical protein
VFLYAHGWKHNASACDNNVICFSRLLERMDILERHRNDALPKGGQAAPARPVVGVYVGWRGLALDAGALSNTTFWTRKATAERVGRGGVKEAADASGKLLPGAQPQPRRTSSWPATASAAP